MIGATRSHSPVCRDKAQDCRDILLEHRDIREGNRVHREILGDGPLRFGSGHRM